jgi:hypothetical protein
MDRVSAFEEPTCELRYVLGVLQQKWRVVEIREQPEGGDAEVIEREEWRKVPDAGDG